MICEVVTAAWRGRTRRRGLAGDVAVAVGSRPVRIGVPCTRSAAVVHLEALLVLRAHLGRAHLAAERAGEDQLVTPAGGSAAVTALRVASCSARIAAAA